MYRNTGKSFWEDLEMIFLNLSRFFRMILKSIFFNFSTNYSFISRFFASLLCNSRTTAPNFNIEVLKRDFQKILERFFQKSFKNIYRDASKSKIFVWVTSHGKIYQLTRNLHFFDVNNFNLCTKNCNQIIFSRLQQNIK